jgi:gluconolactonase
VDAVKAEVVPARVVADGLGFVEGPVALPDGALLAVDLRNSCVWRIEPNGEKRRVVDVEGSLNGAALGPDGRLYACNNGGLDWQPGNDRNLPLGRAARNYIGGRLQAIDLRSGGVETLYSECDGRPLQAPNDLVFDAAGGLYFTDHASALADSRQYGALYYARPDGASIRRVGFPLNHPNGVALSPNGGRLYMADSLVGNLWYWDIEAPGRLAAGPHTGGATFLSRLPNVRVFDSIAVDSLGNIACATLHHKDGLIVMIAPDGELLRMFRLPRTEPFITNVCFGGADMRTAYVTCGSLGCIYAFKWPVAGLNLNFNRLMARS